LSMAIVIRWTACGACAEARMGAATKQSARIKGRRTLGGIVIESPGYFFEPIRPRMQECGKKSALLSGLRTDRFPGSG
jgi:hypothetical protein